MGMTNKSNTLLFVKTHLLDAQCQLIFNTSDQVVTLLQQETLRAQNHFSSYQFRLFALLVKLPGGAIHAELLAMLDCSEQTVCSVLATETEQEVVTLLQPSVQRWQDHLSEIEQRSPQIGRASCRERVSM